jgi:transposase
VAKKIFEVEVQDGYDVADAATILHIGIATVWRWIRNGKLSSFRVRVGPYTKTFVLEKEVDKLKAESSHNF